MKKIEFNKVSEARLETCSESVVKVVKEAAECSPVEFDIVSGAITIDELRQLFKKKKSPYNPDKYVDAVLATKTRYKKELYAKVPNLLEKKKDKSRGFSINCPGGNNDTLCMAVGHILGTANRVLEEGCLVFKGIVDKSASFELISE